MDPVSGRIHQFDSHEAVVAENVRRKRDGKPPLIPMAQQPDPKCRECFGRGHVGRDVVTGLFRPCDCTKPHRGQIVRPWPPGNPPGKAPAA